MARKRKREAQEQAFAEEQVPVEEQPSVGDGGRLTPADVQQKVFRLAFRGYSERDVDEFLDEVTATLAGLHEENKRLKEQLADGGGSPGTTMAAQRQADAIVRQAREEAARIASAAPEAGPPAEAAAPAPASFLVKERAFLQRIASLVQDHARSLKEDARKLRQEPGAETGGAGLGAAAAAAAAGAGGLAAGAVAAEVMEPEDVGSPAAEPEPAPDAAEPGGEAAGMPAPIEEEEPDSQDAGPPDPGSIGGPSTMAAAPAPEEATVPWRAPDQQEGGAPDASGTSTDDPLVAAWESAFAPEGGEPETESGDRPADAREAAGDEEEPSLRELFWGEE